MKKFYLIIIILSLIFLFLQCNSGKHNQDSQNFKGDIKSKKNLPGNDESPDLKTQKKIKKEENQNLNIDEMDIPERLKKAIKSGRIPKERVKEILEKQKEGRQLPLVGIEPVKRHPMNAILVLNGVVEPERKVEVYSRLPAYVKSISKEEGEAVKNGDILALLDDTEIGIDYRQAEIQLKQAELTLKDEEANFQRSKELKEREMISEQDFQAAQAKYNMAILDHQTKQENFKDLELQLNYTKIKSPVNGYITERLIEVGDRVNANQQVYTVEDFSPLLIRVYVPTADIVHLKTRMECLITTDILKGLTFKGNVKLINPRIDVQSGTVKVTIEVRDNTGKLKPGMFVESRVIVSKTADALVIPRKSISYDENKPYVFIYNKTNQQVSKRLIDTGISEGELVEVKKGLSEEEKIVTIGIEGLKDQMKVRISQ